MDRRTLSASQLNTWALCQRKWGWEKIAGLSSPPGAGAELGNRVHGVLETYLLTGELPDQSTQEGEIATAGLHHLPAPGTVGLEIEETFRYVSPGKTEFTGRKDFVVRPFHGPTLIGDHKTLADFKWAKEPVDLRTDTQSVLYAASEYAEGAETVTLEWVYYRTRGTAKSKKIVCEILKPDVEKHLPVLDALADEIHQARETVTDVLTLPPTLSACSAYGGCPFQAKCNFSPQGRLSAIMAYTDPTQELAARLALQALGAPPPPPGPPTALEQLRARQQTVVVETTEVRLCVTCGKASKTALWEANGNTCPKCDAISPVAGAMAGAMAEAPVAPTPVPTPPVAPPPPVPPAGTWYGERGVHYYSCQCKMQLSADYIRRCGGVCSHCKYQIDVPSFVAINPPEQVLPPPPAPVAVPEEKIESYEKVAVNSEGEVIAAAERMIAAKRGRGRPRKDATPETLPAPPSLPTPPAPAAATEAPAARAPIEAPAARAPIDILLIDALPASGNVVYTTASELFQKAASLVKSEYDVEDYRQMEFGKGPGIFCLALQQVLSASELGIVTTESGTPEGAVSLITLIRNARAVIRGTR